MMPLVSGFRLGDRTWEGLGKFTNVIPSLSSLSLHLLDSSCRPNLLLEGGGGGGRVTTLRAFVPRLSLGNFAANELARGAKPPCERAAAVQRGSARFDGK